MENIWYTFAAQMGDNQAWITYNHGYGDFSKTDKRNNHFEVRVAFKNPTEYGMPTNEEFSDLSKLDEKLDNYISAKKGIYVGRITVNGHRYFHFYINFPEKEAKNIIDKVSTETNYKLQYILELDSKKDSYWNELYPTDDDWQVIEDLKVLDALSNDGDNKDKSREVQHWAYFPKNNTAEKFKEWILENNYKLIYLGPTEDNIEFEVRYSHIGTMNLGDITHSNNYLF